MWGRFFPSVSPEVTVTSQTLQLAGSALTEPPGSSPGTGQLGTPGYRPLYAPGDSVRTSQLLRHRG